MESSDPRLGRPLTIYPSLREPTGDLETAIFASALLSLAGADGWVRATAAEIEEATGLSRRRQERARRRLEDLGALLETRTGMPARLSFRLELDRVFEPARPVPAAPKRERKRPERKAASLDSVIETALGGGYDGRTRKSLADDKELQRAALVHWARCWGKRQGAVALTTARVRVWRKAVKDEGRLPSAFFRAIVGMTHDGWPKRDDYADWSHVARGLERWVELYEATGGVPAVRRNSLGFATKEVRGVVVPLDYAWRAGDDFALELGERFDPRERRWVKPDEPGFVGLAALNGGERR